MDFETFLREVIRRDASEVRLVPVRIGTAVRFYAHPQGGVGGRTVDFEVRGNRLVALPFDATTNKESPI
jgi:hypothetical protein